MFKRIWKMWTIWTMGLFVISSVIIYGISVQPTTSCPPLTGSPTNVNGVMIEDLRSFDAANTFHLGIPTYYQQDPCAVTQQSGGTWFLVPLLMNMIWAAVLGLVGTVLTQRYRGKK